MRKVSLAAAAVVALAAFCAPASAATLNEFVTIIALIVGFSQMVFLFNLVWSYFKGRVAERNPWQATTLEWQTPEMPPGHGNWGATPPVVYRWEATPPPSSAIRP